LAMESNQMEHAHPTGQQPQEVQVWHTIKTVV